MHERLDEHVNDFFEDSLQLVFSFDVNIVFFHIFVPSVVDQTDLERQLTGALELLNADAAVACHEILCLYVLVGTVDILNNAELLWQQISVFFNELFFQSSPA